MAVRTAVVFPSVLGLLLAGSVPLAAQTRPETQIQWEVGAPKAGWCIHFLIEPEEATRDMVRGYQPVPAQATKWLAPPIQRLISDEPEYAAWVPSVLCTYTAETVVANRKRFEKGDGGQPVAFLYWGVSASAEGQSPDSGGMTFRALATNSSGLQRAMEVNSFPMDRVPIQVKALPGGVDEQFQLKLDGATIFFDGHPRADSTLQVSQESRVGAYKGSNNALWSVRVSVTPTDVAWMSGALRIQGKKGLAKILNQSPIRLLGQVVSGGQGEVDFAR